MVPTIEISSYHGSYILKHNITILEDIMYIQ
jgi:hypothetical protein